MSTFKSIYSKKSYLLFIITLTHFLASANAALGQPNSDAFFAHLQSLNTGRFRFLLLENDIVSNALRSDTITVSFTHGDGKSNGLRFVAEDKTLTYLYKDSEFARVHWKDSTIFLSHLKEEEAIEKVGAWFKSVRSLLTNGSAFEENMRREGVRIVSSDTLIGRDSLFQFDLKYESASASQINSDANSLEIRYLFGMDSIFRGAEVTTNELHLTSWTASYLLNWSFGESERQAVDKKIDREVARIYSSQLHEARKEQDSSTSWNMYRDQLAQLLQVGESAPPIEGQTAQGDRVNVFQNHPRLVLLDFWYADCPPCLRMMGVLKKLSKEYAARGLVVVAANSTDSPSMQQKIKKREGIEFLEVSIPREVQNAFGVTGFPTLYLLDKDSRVIDTQIGFGPDTEIRIRKVIDENLKN